MTVDKIIKEYGFKYYSEIIKNGKYANYSKHIQHHECQVLQITFSFFIRSTNCGIAYAKMKLKGSVPFNFLIRRLRIDMTNTAKNLYNLIKGVSTLFMS